MREKRRYKRILDVLANDIRYGKPVYDKITFDHKDEELNSLYREICLQENNSLYQLPQEIIEKLLQGDISSIRGNKRRFQRKQSDVCGIVNGKVRIIIEEETNPNRFSYDKKKILSCSVRIDKSNNLYPIENAILFLLGDDSVKTRKFGGKGHIDKIIECSKNEFEKEYEKIKNNIK